MKYTNISIAEVQSIHIIVIRKNNNSTIENSIGGGVPTIKCYRIML